MTKKEIHTEWPKVFGMEEDEISDELTALLSDPLNKEQVVTALTAVLYKNNVRATILLANMGMRVNNRSQF